MTLSPEDFPVPLISIEHTNSTNSYLRDFSYKRRATAFTTVMSDFQTAGRGQRGNSWESEEGRNLLFSCIIFPDFLEARRQFLLSQIVSLSIKEILDNYTQGISIKWPNDIYWQERKICGILIENDIAGNSICQTIAGAGININQQEFRSSAPNPVSLWQITGKEHDCREILAQIMVRIKEYYTLLLRSGSTGITARYEEALFRRKGLYCYADTYGKFLAEVVRITPEGLLVLRDSAGKERKYAFKEVQYVL